MVSLIKPRPAEHGLLAAKPSSRTASSSGHERAGGSRTRTRDVKAQAQTQAQAKAEAGVRKPWADQPWPLIDLPSRTQNITHPALHIANEITHIHNAMLRGLNAIYLQVPHVRQAQDITDLMFLTQSWSTWLLDYHELKEGTMLPAFEAALGVSGGTLTLLRNRSPSVAVFYQEKEVTTTKETGDGKETDAEEEMISFLLHRVYAYASAIHKDTDAYNATTLEELIVALADVLVPHLTGQIGLLASMRDLCFGSAALAPANKNVPGPLPMPMTAITRTSPKASPSSGSPAASPPVSPSLSTFSAASASTASASSAHSPPPGSLSLFPPPARTHKSTNSSKQNLNAESKNMAVIDTEAKERLARARALLEADSRATKLTQIYQSADASASAKLDRFVVLPMIVRLRDITFAAALSRMTPLSRPMSTNAGMNMFGGGNTSEWPRMSIPAVHAIADKLSPRHEGAWRFLPCDVWGRPRELPFLE